MIDDLYRQVQNITHTLLVKHYNDLLDRQSSEGGRDEVTYFYVGEYTLALCMPILKKKSLRRFLEETSKLFIVLTLQQRKVWNFSPINIREDFFLKISIHRAKIYTKNVPNIEVCNFLPPPLRTLSIQASHCSALLIGFVKFCTWLYVIS